MTAPGRSDGATNEELLLNAVRAIAALRNLTTTNIHTQQQSENIPQYIVRDLRMLSHSYGISKDDFMEALR